jgi:hypothetical protein
MSATQHQYRQTTDTITCTRVLATVLRKVTLPLRASTYLSQLVLLVKSWSIRPPGPELGDVNHAASGSTNTTRPAVEDSPEEHKQGRRDVSGGSGETAVTAVDSGCEDIGTVPKHHHVQFGVLSGKGKVKSRLHPLFANLSTSSRNAEKENITFMESASSFNAPKTFKHHLKNLVPPPPTKLHKHSSPDLKGSGAARPGWIIKGLPGDLKAVSEVVVKEILEGHQMLSERLRARYEEQYRKLALFLLIVTLPYQADTPLPIL